MTFGVLVATLSGGCSFIIVAWSVLKGGGFGSLGPVLAVGGIPFAVGAALYFAGRKMGSRAVEADKNAEI